MLYWCNYIVILLRLVSRLITFALIFTYFTLISPAIVPEALPPSPHTPTMH